MAETTGIAWTDSTFNPWIGCTEVSPGCDNCYARALDARHRWKGATHWGSGKPRMRTSESNWQQPLIWNRRAAAAGTRHLVFCASLADVFDNEVPDSWRSDLWNLINATPALTWLILTKRIGNAVKMMPGGMANVWLGASVVNQLEADRDIPKLLAAVAAKRFVSYEPALGPIYFSHWLGKQVCCGNAVQVGGGYDEPPEFECCRDGIAGLDWVIVGGESTQGAPARPFVIDWARDTMEQCRATGAAFFMKQFGAHATNREGMRYPFKDKSGSDMTEWPEDLRVQEFPS